MATIKEIYGFLDKKAPFSTQMSFDNAGFLVGRGEAVVSRVLVALDITQEVVAEAINLGAQLIVSHHPIIFHPAKSITDGDATGRTLLAMVEHGIGAICAHTNLDVATGGVNDALAQAVGLSNIDFFLEKEVDAAGNSYGLGRIGTVFGDKDIPFTEFADTVKTALRAGGIRCVDGGKPVHRVAVGGGACAGHIMDAVAMGCDTFITSDAKYNDFLDAKDLGLNLIDAGHYPTEQVICPVLVDWLQTAFPAVTVTLSTCHKEVFSYR